MHKTFALLMCACLTASAAPSKKKLKHKTQSSFVPADKNLVGKFGLLADQVDILESCQKLTEDKLQDYGDCASDGEDPPAMECTLRGGPKYRVLAFQTTEACHTRELKFFVDEKKEFVGQYGFLTDGKKVVGDCHRLKKDEVQTFHHCQPDASGPCFLTSQKNHLVFVQNTENECKEFQADWMPQNTTAYEGKVAVEKNPETGRGPCTVVDKALAQKLSSCTMHDLWVRPKQCFIEIGKDKPVSTFEIYNDLEACHLGESRSPPIEEQSSSL